MKLDCYIVKDLLPAYLDEVCSEETATCLEEHLADCETCRQEKELMWKAFGFEALPTEDDTKKIQHAVSFFKRNVVIKILLGICLLCVLSAGLYLGVNQCRGNGVAFSSIPVFYLVQKYENALQTQDSEKIHQFQTEYMVNAAYDESQIHSAIASLNTSGVAIKRVGLLKSELQEGQNIGLLEIECSNNNSVNIPKGILLKFILDEGKIRFFAVSEFIVSQEELAKMPSIGDKMSYPSWLNDLYCILGYSQ